MQHNLPKLPPAAGKRWPALHATLKLRHDVLTIDRPVLFDASKDKPVLFAALAWANTLLTLDQKDFAPITNQPFYGLHILTPGNFLRRERTAGRLT